jgi:predicted dehydrogenase
MQVAIVGLGGYGWGLANRIIEYGRHHGHRLAAAADPALAQMPDRAETLREAGVKLFARTDEMYDEMGDEIRGVYIATGIHTHMPLTCEAFERGLHVHLEKPAAATVQEVDRMEEVRRRNQRLCLVGFQAMHQQDLLACRDQLASGVIGRREEISCFACWPRDAGYYQRNRWAGQLRLGDAWVLDGPATNALAHQIMNILLLAGDNRPADPVSVRAELYAAGDRPSHDTAAIEIRTQQGPRCVLLLTHRCKEMIHPAMQVRASNGRATWYMHGGYEIVPNQAEKFAGTHDDRNHERMIENFFWAVEAEDPSRLGCDLQQARKMVQVVDAAHESSGEIHRIGPEFLDASSGSEAFPDVKDIESIFERCADRCVLPSDLSPVPPWAKATEPWPVSDYHSFPARFGHPPAG